MTKDKLCCVLTEEQAAAAISAVNLEKRKGLPNTVEYWKNLGLTDENAIIEVNRVQKLRSAKSPAAQKGAQGYSCRTIEYWTKHGLTIEEARAKVKEHQTRNGLAYYTKKYGLAGEEMFNDRMQRWLDSPGNKEMVANRSKKSIELFEQLGAGYYGANERTVRGREKVHRVDFLYKNKIIEFYGDYWHGNPKLYPNDAMIRQQKIGRAHV